MVGGIPSNYQTNIEPNVKKLALKHQVQPPIDHKNCNCSNIHLFCIYYLITQTPSRGGVEKCIFSQGVTILKILIIIALAECNQQIHPTVYRLLIILSSLLITTATSKRSFFTFRRLLICI